MGDVDHDSGQLCQSLSLSYHLDGVRLISLLILFLGVREVVGDPLSPSSL